MTSSRLEWESESSQNIQNPKGLKVTTSQSPADQYPNYYDLINGWAKWRKINVGVLEDRKLNRVVRGPDGGYMVYRLCSGLVHTAHTGLPL